MHVLQGSPFPSNPQDTDTDSNNMLFMLNEEISFNDGDGTTDSATYLGPILREDILKHKIKRSNGKEFLVDREHIYSTSVPDIASVPIKVEQYASELPNLTKQQLHQIANPQILDDDQRELMDLHCKMNHIPFPALIRMAESGHIKKRLAKVKDRIPNMHVLHLWYVSPASLAIQKQTRHN